MLHVDEELSFLAIFFQYGTERLGVVCTPKFPAAHLWTAVPSCPLKRPISPFPRTQATHQHQKLIGIIHRHEVSDARKSHESERPGCVEALNGSNPRPEIHFCH